MIILEGKGNCNENNIKGDIKLFVKIANNTAFIRNGLNLHYQYTITLKEALMGFAFQLDHLNVRRWVKGKGVWQQLQVTLYDPVVPSAAQACMEWIRLSHESVTGRDGYSDFYKKDVTFNMLGPVGDVVEEWVLKGCWCKDVNFGDMDFASSDPMEITATLSKAA